MFKKIIDYRDIFAIIFLCCCSFIFLNNLFLQSQIFTAQDLGRGDITHYTYPDRNYYGQEIKSYRIPLWTNYISTGYPIFAEGQLGAFFLPNLISYFLFPAYFAFNLTYLIAFITASIGVYFYCRYLHFSLFSSLFASIAYSFSFVFIGQILHITVLQAISLFPWLMLLTDKYFSTGKRVYLLIFAILFAQQYLTGFIQCVIYSIIAIYIMVFFRYFRQANFIRNTMFLFLACLLALCISAIQFIPSIELYLNSTSSNSVVDNSKYLYSVKDLIYFVDPFYWGDPSKATYVRNPVDGLFWENNIYSGILPFIFLLIGFLYFKKQENLKPFIYLFCLTLFFSLGWFFFLQYFPPFSMFRLPQRALFITSFAYAIIAGFGFDLIYYKFKKKISQKFIISIIGTIIVVAAFLDLFLYGFGYNGGIAKNVWLKTPDTAKYLESQHISGRILSLGGIDTWFYVYNTLSHGWRGPKASKLLATRATLNSNANMLYGISTVDSYTLFETPNSVLINQIIFYGDKANRSTYDIGTSSAKLLGMEAVEYLVSTKNVTSDSNDFQLVWQKFNTDSQTMYSIYKNKQFVGRIHAVSEIRGEQSVQQMVNDLLSSNFTPQNTALVLAINPPQKFTDKVSITQIKDDSPNISFHTSSLGNSFIVIADSDYPGWRVFIDNQESSLLSVNINSKGMIIPPGNHNIVLFYDPDSYKYGKFISFISLLIVVVLLLWPKVKKIINHTNQ